MGFSFSSVKLGEEVELKSLEEILEVLNGESRPEVLDFSLLDFSEVESTEEEPDEPVPAESELMVLSDNDQQLFPPVNVSPEDRRAVSEVDFESLDDNLRAHTLRQMLRDRFLHNHYQTFCRPHLERENEVRTSIVNENWNTGLSQGAISRHIKTTVEEMESEGYLFYASRGRYRLIRGPRETAEV